MLVFGQMIDMGQTDDQRKAFMHFVEDLGLIPLFMSLRLWGRGVPNQDALMRLRYPCNNPLYSVIILCNGDVAACCMDFNGTNVFGNLKTDSIEEIWSGPLLAFREAQLLGNYGKYSVCQNCCDWVTFGMNRYSDIIREVKERKTEKYGY